MKSILAFSLAVALATSALPAQAATPPAQSAHHPAAAAPESAARMDAHLERMRALHRSFLAAKSPQERRALVPAQMQALQECVDMMDTMAAGAGAMHPAGAPMHGQMGGHMPGGMDAHQQEMHKHMAMMHAMMQLMLDRLAAQPQ